MLKSNNYVRSLDDEITVMIQLCSTTELLFVCRQTK